MTQTRVTARLKRSGIAAALISSVVLAGCSSTDEPAPGAAGDDAPETTSLTVGVTPVGDFAAIYYAAENGIFEKHGLDVTIDPKGASEVPPLVANSYQMVSMSWTTYIQALAQGIELRGVFPGIVGEPDTQTGIYTMPATGIDSPDDLGGRTLAINQPKATLELNSRLALEEAGVDPDTVNFQVLPLATMVDALVGGQVDSAYLMPPFSTTAESRGATQVLDAYAGKLAASPIAGYVMTREFAEENPNTVAAVQAAMTEAAEVMNNPDEYRAFVTSYTNLTPELAQQSPAFEFPTTIDVPALQAYADLMADQGFATRRVDIAGSVINPSA